MNAPARLSHEFVDFIPECLEPRVLYVSITYAIVVHLCACGCGNKTVTPLGPKQWKLTFDGETIGLYPSVGNYSFPCRSHYWVRENHARWVIDDTPTGGRRISMAPAEQQGTSPAELPPIRVGTERSGLRNLVRQVIHWRR